MADAIASYTGPSWKKNARIYVTCEENPTSGVLGLVNCLRQEEGGVQIRCIFGPEETEP